MGGAERLKGTVVNQPQISCVSRPARLVADVKEHSNALKVPFYVKSAFVAFVFVR